MVIGGDCYGFRGEEDEGESDSYLQFYLFTLE